MKNWMTFAFTWGTIALLFSDSVKAEQPEMDGVCSVLNALTPEAKALTRFNAMVFGDFIAGKNANIMGPLAVKGTLTGENARINSKKTTACAVSEDALEHHGLVLGGANASPITVNGFASLAIQDDKVVTPLDACAVPNEATLDFEKVHQSALDMSRKLAGMLPNWSIDADGVMVNLVSEGVKTDQPFNLFTMPACTMGACKAVNYFDCGDGTDCEAPPHMLSSVDTMFLGQGEWNGPLEEPFPNSEMVVLNIPVLDQHTFDMKTADPSIGLNACNTIYNFYAIDEAGKYNPEGHFTIKRSTTEPLSGMVLAPQAHILDDVQGSFSGQVIAASYEALGDNLTVKDYVSSGDNQCQTFQGCLTGANSLPEEMAEVPAEEMAEPLEEIKEETNPEEVKEEVKEETTPEEVKEETTPEEVKEDTKPEEVKEDTKPEEVKEDTKPEEEKKEEVKEDTKPEEEQKEEVKEEATPEEEKKEEVKEDTKPEEEQKEEVKEDELPKIAEENEIKKDDIKQDEAQASEVMKDEIMEDQVLESEVMEDQAQESNIQEDGSDEIVEQDDIAEVFDENEEPWNNVIQAADVDADEPAEVASEEENAEVVSEEAVKPEEASEDHPWHHGEWDGSWDGHWDHNE